VFFIGCKIVDDVEKWKKKLFGKLSSREASVLSQTHSLGIMKLIGLFLLVQDQDDTHASTAIRIW
jgi:hypothetical protein